MNTTFDPTTIKEYAISYRYDGNTGNLFITDAFNERDALLEFFKETGPAAAFHTTDINIGLYKDGRIIPQAMIDTGKENTDGRH